MASIQKDKTTGKWYCRVTYYDENGNRKLKTKKGFATKREAEVAAAQLEIKREEQGDLSSDKNLTIFSVFFEEWCKTYKLNKFSTKTEQRYLREIKIINNHFGNKPMNGITRMDYQNFINQRGKGRSRDTVVKTHGAIKNCVQYALHDGLIDKDFTFGTVISYDVKPSKKKNYLSKSDSDKIIKYTYSSDDYKDLMIYIAITTGLRVGEVYGLSYSDITKDTLSVNRGYNYDVDKDFTGSKNESSIRTISSTKELYSKVKKHRLMNQKINKEYLFLDPLNKPRISHNGLQKHLHKILKLLEIEKVNFHGLRHTHASILIGNNISIAYVSKRLGHADIMETLRTYTHLFEELEQTGNQEVEKLSLLFDSVQ